jgi:hypothetical protein
MLRTLIVLAALAISGCATTGGHSYNQRQAIYRDGSYYSPSVDGYGDYYYAPEYRDAYYDHFGYGFHGYGYPYGWNRGCMLRYRPCPWGYDRWRSGWGFSLFFGSGWDDWYRWPYHYRDPRWHDRDRRGDREGHHGGYNGDPNRRLPPDQANPGNTRYPGDVRRPGMRVPGVGDRNRIRDEVDGSPRLPRMRVGDDGDNGGSNDVNARPAPEPRASREAPEPHESRESSRNDEPRPEPRRMRSSSNERRDGPRRRDD